MAAAGPASQAARWWLHLRLAVLFGIPLAAAMAGVELLLRQEGPAGGGAVCAQAAQGLLAGLVVSVVLGIGQWRAAVGVRDRRIALDPTAPRAVDLRMRAERTTVVPLPGTEILGLAGDLATMLGSRSTAVDEAAGTVTLETSAAIGTWGERVVLTVGSERPEGTTVTVSSCPRHVLQVLDCGRNGQNVERTATWLAGLALQRQPDRGNPAG